MVLVGWGTHGGGGWGAEGHTADIRSRLHMLHVNIPSPPKLLLQLLESDYSVGRIFLLNLVLCPILNIHNAVSLSLLPWMLR